MCADINMYTQMIRTDNCKLRFRVQGLAGHGYCHGRELVCRTRQRTISVKVSVCMLNWCVLALADCHGPGPGLGTIVCEWGLARASKSLERHLIKELG